jgi:hypothetical protein
MAPDTVLLVSCSNANAGGLVAIDEAGVRPLDRLATHGLGLRGDRLFRVLSCVEHAAPASDLIVSDERGVKRFERLDGIGDAHDVLPRDTDALVVSSIDNAVYAVGDDGTIHTWWKHDAPADAWHVNCLTAFEDGIVVTAFGTFDSYRAWSREPHAATGVLMRLPSEEVLVRGLAQPHTPRRLEGGWLLCNSILCELTAYDDRGTVLRRRRLDGYTRGLAFDEQHLYVGESASREYGLQHDTARITILDRATWNVVDSIEVDGPEIYDIILAPRALEEGLRVGFRTNPTRVQQEDQISLFTAAGVTPHRLWATGDPLPRASLRAALEIVLPPIMAANAVVTLPCRVTNRGDAIYVSAPPNPIELCYRWYDAGGAAYDAGRWIHTPLPRALPPGESLDCAMRIAAPEPPGVYTLAVTLLQEQVAWFDDVAPENGVRDEVAITVAGR